MGFSNRDIRSNVTWYLYDFSLFTHTTVNSLLLQPIFVKKKITIGVPVKQLVPDYSRFISDFSDLNSISVVMVERHGKRHV